MNKLDSQVLKVLYYKLKYENLIINYKENYYALYNKQKDNTFTLYKSKLYGDLKGRSYQFYFMDVIVVTKEKLNNMLLADLPENDYKSKKTLVNNYKKIIHNG